MSLATLVIRRLLVLPFMLVGMTLIMFALTHLIPGDPILSNLGQRAAADPAIVAAFRERWGLNKSLPVQYSIYLGRLAHGDMGTSISTHRPVSRDLRQRVPATVEVAVAAALITVLFAIPFGMLSALHRGRALDQITRLVSLFGVSVPEFWLGLVAIVIFYNKLGWAPPPGRLSATIDPPPFVTGFLVIDGLLAHRLDVVVDTLKHVVLPAFVIASYGLGIVTRIVRSSMLDVLSADYVRTARAKGLRERVVVTRHAARNALIPVLTVIGLNFGALLSGAVVVEAVFSWPGLGLYAFQAASALDFPAIMGVGMVVAVVYIAVNLAVDVTYALVDPRIRVSG